jgi:hypothetical protein
MAGRSVPVSGAIADDTATLRVRHGGLGLPDAIVLVVAELIDADADGRLIGARRSSAHPPIRSRCFSCPCLPAFAKH